MEKIRVSTSELNSSQHKAVMHGKGPAIVIAGAGTGKTRVITDRIVQLIDEGVDPNSILALTFTEKAAGEMLDRVNNARGSYTLDTTIATFNGFGDEIVKNYGFEIGLGNTSLLGDTGKLVFLREHIDELKLNYFAPISKPDSQLELIIKYISDLKQHLITPEEYTNFTSKMPATNEESKLEKQKHTELANAYTTYTVLCRSYNHIDYDDQIYLAVQLLQTRPNIQKQLQDRFQYLLVDEYQDTNTMQSTLLDLLTGNEQNIMVVGDDDQSIYGWRGATLANILDFTVRYPEAKQITLTQNYRSTQNILDSAYKLIQNNNPNRLESINKLDKKLLSNTSTGQNPKFLNFGRLDAELEWITKDIISKISNGQDPASIAVLARRNTTVQKLHDIFELNRLDHAVTGLSNDIYDQTVVRQLIEVLKTVADPNDRSSLYHTLTGPIFELNPEQLSTWLSEAKNNHQDLIEIINSSDNKDAINAVELIKKWRSFSANTTIGKLAYKIITSTDWLKKLVESAKSDELVSTQVHALSQYFKLLKEFEKISNTGSLLPYIESLETLRSSGSELHDPSLDISDSKVNILSVHRSKGLEWDLVYIADCTEGSFPMRKFGSGIVVPEELKKMSEADEHIAEERRLMYVAITRAKNDLVITFSDTHSGNTKRRPSRFISEITDNKPEKVLEISEAYSNESFKHKETTRQISLPSKMKQGDKIVLSVSEVDKWLNCPLDFYYRYVLQVPQPPNPSQSHGTIIHSCIEQINNGLTNGTLPELTELLANAKENLPVEGYMTALQRNRAHKQLIDSISKVYERFSTSVAPIHSELPFRVEIPNSKIIIKGRIDAVYSLDNGVEIRDYKTGSSVKSADKAKQRATSSQQLALYAMAWRQMEGEMPALLSLDFVETGFVGSVKKQPKTIDNLEIKLSEIPEKLLRNEFEPGKDHTFCIHPI